MEVMQKHGYLRIAVSAQCFFNAVEECLVIVHGDDFMAVGEPRALDKLDLALDSSFTIKRAARVGPSELGGSPLGSFLKRTLWWTSEGYHWIPGEVHADRIVDYFQTQPPVRQVSPASKHVGKAARDAEDPLQ
eukprot:5130772-Amphidinium_carterae.1